MKRVERMALHDEGFVGKRWGSRGAGILLTDGSRALLLLRSGQVEEPHTWGVPGGAVRRDGGAYEDLLAAARNEAHEEMGGLPEGAEVIGQTVFTEGAFTFTTFIARVSPSDVLAFTPRLNCESDRWFWFNAAGLPANLHPGVSWALQQPGVAALVFGDDASFGLDEPESAPRASGAHVEPPSIVYHGTHAKNLPSILRSGSLTPKGGYSPHRTVTRDATFVTDTLPSALMYSTAGVDDAHAIVFEIKSEGLALRPDLDDAGLLIDADLEELHRILNIDDGDLRIGEQIPDDLFDEVVDALQQLGDDGGGGERQQPTALDTMGDFLVARPFVLHHVAEDNGARAGSDLYEYSAEMIYWDDNRPVMLTQQFMCMCDIGVANIVAVLIDRGWFTENGLDVPSGVGATEQRVTDYSVIDRELDEDGEDVLNEYGEPTLSFRERVLVRLPFAAARALVGASAVAAAAVERMAMRTADGTQFRRGLPKRLRAAGLGHLIPDRKHA